MVLVCRPSTWDWTCGSDWSWGYWLIDAVVMMFLLVFFIGNDCCCWLQLVFVSVWCDNSAVRSLGVDNVIVAAIVSVKVQVGARWENWVGLGCEGIFWSPGLPPDDGIVTVGSRVCEVEISADMDWWSKWCPEVILSGGRCWVCGWKNCELKFKDYRLDRIGCGCPW